MALPYFDGAPASQNSRRQKCQGEHGVADRQPRPRLWGLSLKRSCWAVECRPNRGSEVNVLWHRLSASYDPSHTCCMKAKVLAPDSSPSAPADPSCWLGARSAETAVGGPLRTAPARPAWRAEPSSRHCRVEGNRRCGAVRFPYRLRGSVQALRHQVPVVIAEASPPIRSLGGKVGPVNLEMHRSCHGGRRLKH